jgi:hypothetical protein
LAASLHLTGAGWPPQVFLPSSTGQP